VAEGGTRDEERSFVLRHDDDRPVDSAAHERNCRCGKERKGKERKGKERKGKERKGKERNGKERQRQGEGKGGGAEAACTRL
jgi:hypothetical protein